MQMLSSQYMDLTLGAGATSIGTPSIGVMGHGLLQLVNSSTITLSGATPLDSVSAYFGGYNGYAAETITWQPPSLAAEGGVEVLAEPVIFRPTDSANPQNIWGVVVTDAGGDNLLFAMPFDAPPLPMASTLNTISITLRWQPHTGGVVAVVA